MDGRSKTYRELWDETVALLNQLPELEPGKSFEEREKNILKKIKQNKAEMAKLRKGEALSAKISR